MAQRFHIIDDAVVILRSRGVYRQAKLYRRGNELYAGYGAGFVRLLGGKGTSAPNISWEEMEAGLETTIDSLGRPSIAPPARMAIAS